MAIRIDDERCLRPRVLGRGAIRARRVQGVLARAGEPAGALLVDAVEFDGKRCRYRTLGLSRDAGAWCEARDGDDYTSCAQSIIDGLRRLCTRLDGADESSLSLVDSAIGDGGRLWVALRDERRCSCRWLPLHGV